MKKRIAVLAAVAAVFLSVTWFADRGYCQQRADATQATDVKKPPTSQERLPKSPKSLGAGLEVLADLSVAPVTYDGPCPARFTFKGYITANRATTVQYKFVRSDGVVTKPVALTFEKGGRQEVTTTWEIGERSAASGFSGWAYLEVVFPLNRKIQSDTIFPKGTCRGQANAPGLPGLQPVAQGQAAAEKLPGQPAGPGVQTPTQALPGQQSSPQKQTVVQSPFDQAPPRQQQTVVQAPLDRQKAQQAPPRDGEDCVTFDPDAATVQQTQGKWTVASGPYTLFSFGLDKVEAENALAIVKHYKMSQTCFVGRPRPSFHYMLAGGASPAGPFPGEDCKPFDPASAKVQQVKNSWKIVDRSGQVFDFGPDKAQAEQSLSVIKKYGFTHSCMMARGMVDFLYLRK